MFFAAKLLFSELSWSIGNKIDINKKLDEEKLYGHLGDIYEMGNR